MAAVWTCDNCGGGEVTQIGGAQPSLRFTVSDGYRRPYYLCSGDCLVEWAVMNAGTKKYVLETTTETRLAAHHV